MVFAVLTAFLFLGDFFLKKYIEKHMQMGEKKEICKGRILLRRYHNYGAAFNALDKHPGLVRKFCGGLMLVLGILWFIVLRKKKNPCLKLGMCMLIGGGGSNLYDRLTRGYVVDYFSFRTPWKWLNRIVFNISDFFIFLGCILAAVSGE